MVYEVLTTENETEIHGYEERISELNNTILSLHSKIMGLEELISHYEEQFRRLARSKYAAHSEKSKYDMPEGMEQISFFNEAEVTADSSIPEPKAQEIQPKPEQKEPRPKRTRLTTGELPDRVPDEIIRHDIEENEKKCPNCGNDMHEMSCDCHSEVVVIPAQIKVIRHEYPVYSCRNCERTADAVPIITADKPEPVIKGSFASPEAIAYFIMLKYVLGLPLYRIEQDMKRNGIPLSRQTISNWFMRATEYWLDPIYNRLHELLIKEEVLHADETTTQVLHEPGKAPQKKSYMWLYRTSGDAKRHIVLYEYQPDRRYERPREFLHGFSGYIHADGYDGYHKLPDTMTIVGCLSHLRRKFDEALKNIPAEARAGSIAMRGKQYCNELFEQEREFSKYPPLCRYRLRRKLAMPVLDEFCNWAEEQMKSIAPKSMLGKALYYTLSQRKYIYNYLLDGRLEISNNRAERSIKPFVMGRKAWLFSNTVKGAKVSATIYSLMETAKENGLNPYEYLKYVFTVAPNGAKLSEILPFRDAVPESAHVNLQQFDRNAWDVDP